MSYSVIRPERLFQSACSLLATTVYIFPAHFPESSFVLASLPGSLLSFPLLRRDESRMKEEKK